MEYQSLTAFTQALSGKDPAPGGGGASACTGAYGCALGMMACALTRGKKKYACYETDLTRIEQTLAGYRDILLACIEEDAEGFLPLSRAYGLPKETPEQKLKKEQILEEALFQASQTPMKILTYSSKAMILLEELSGKASRLIVSDVSTGAALLEAAARGGQINVAANTSLMKNQERAKKLDEQAASLLQEALLAHERLNLNTKRK